MLPIFSIVTDHLIDYKEKFIFKIDDSKAMISGFSDAGPVWQS